MTKSLRMSQSSAIKGTFLVAILDTILNILIFTTCQMTNDRHVTMLFILNDLMKINTEKGYFQVILIDVIVRN